MPEEGQFTQNLNQPPVTPQPSDSNNLVKYILLGILGLVLLGGSAFAGYWYGTKSANLKNQTSKPTPVPQPTPALPAENETKSWRTYTDGEFFSVRVPSSWRQLSIQASGSTKSRMGFSDEEVGDEIGIIVRQDAYDEFTGQAEQLLLKDTQAQPASLAGVTALRYEGYSGEAGSRYTVRVITQRGVDAFSISFQTPALPGGGEDTSIFDQILSTFKFLD